MIPLVLNFLTRTNAGGGVNTSSFLAYDDWLSQCNSNVYAVDGYETGLVASMDYEKSNLYTVGSDANGDLNTILQLDFIVPTRYAAQYAGSSMEILLHNSTDSNEIAAGAAEACFTSCDQAPGGVCTNSSICLQGTNDVFWFINSRHDDPCMSDVQVQMNWTDAVNNRFLKMSAPNENNPRDNGDVVEIFFDARILLWTAFAEKSEISGYLEWDDGSVRTDDGGWAINPDGNQDNSNPNIWINETRFLDYTIPFFLVFPRSVQAEFEFIVASTVTVLTVTGKTEVVNIDIHANKSETEFGQLDVTFKTSVQFPYAVRGPREQLGNIRMNSTDPNGPRVEFVEWDDSAECYNDDPDQCEQSFTVRIFPTEDTPCKVDGTYTVQGWTKCVNTNSNQNVQQPQPCALNDLDLDIGNLTNNNGYFTFDIVLPEQSWCPRIVDEVVVTPKLNLFNDADFETPIYNQGNSIGDIDVFSNNWIYCEVVYETSSDTTAIDSSVEGDVLIDIARATKIYMDVQLKNVPFNVPGTDGSQDEHNSPQLTLTEIENAAGSFRDGVPETDVFAWDNEPHITSWADLLAFDGGYAVTQDIVIDASKTQYRVLLCETNEVESYTVYNSNVSLDDCFTNTTSTAIKFFDLGKVLDSEGETAGNCAGLDEFGNARSNTGGIHNCIDENEIAWKFRLDERIIPMDPDIDNGEIRIWVESEVYYIGNYQLTRRRIDTGLSQRRRLQSLNGPTRVQDLITSASFEIRHRRFDLMECNMHALEAEGILTLEFQMSQAKMATEFATDLDAINWAVLLGSQIESVMNMPHTVQVVGLTKCAMTCNQIFIVEGHNLDETADSSSSATLVVSLKFMSNKLARAGHILNIIQKQLKDEDSFIFRDVPAFDNNILTHMKVEGFCMDTPHYHSPSRSEDNGEFSEPQSTDEKNNKTTLLLAAAAGFLLALILGFCVRCYTTGKRSRNMHAFERVSRTRRDGTISTVL